MDDLSPELPWSALMFRCDPTKEQICPAPPVVEYTTKLALGPEMADIHAKDASTLWVSWTAQFS